MLLVSKKQSQASSQRKSKSGNMSEHESHAASSVITGPSDGNGRLELCLSTYFLRAPLPRKPAIENV